ncbi:hypothetical protein [Castellaniella sp. GW247-6E4]|uniref:hypothetical protein n=1 Tax=Castellaniella sp. GW247-6E4 TaxID=3140380 RepID=UPI0033157105
MTNPDLDRLCSIQEIKRLKTRYCHYEEAYRREDGCWRIAHLRLCRMRLIPLPPDHPRPHLPPP